MKLDLQFDEVFEHPIDAVWRAVTDPQTLARWLMENDFEPRVGHKFTLRDPPSSAWRGWIECEVLELDAPRRMVWSWNGGMDGETATRVSFDLRAEGERTRLVFRHVGDATDVQSGSFRAGWTRKMSGLHDALGPDYARRVAFHAPRERVFEAIATLDGLRGWWTTLVSGSTKVGGEVRFDFKGMDEHIIMRVDAARRPSSLRWTCLLHTDLEDWSGTKVMFQLVERGSPEACELSFRHMGLTPALACYGDCELGWEHFLASLVAYVERGKGTPFGASAREKRGASERSAR